MVDRLPFDTVEVDGQHLSVEDFLALPLFKRVRYLLGGGLTFLQGGMPVDQTVALRELRARSV